MDRIEEASGDDRELTSEELELWARIVDAVSSVIADVEQFEGDRYRQLDDGVGMQLTMFPGELSINSPYWFEGDEAERVVEKLRQVSLAVEGVTGLVAYDPQAEAAFLADGSSTAAATFDRVGAAMREHLSVDESTPPARPWWAFWRR